MGKHEMVRKLKEREAIRFGDFTLASGKKSKYYVDMKKASTDVEFLKIVTEEFAKYVEDDIDRVAGIELGAIPILVALALKKDKSFLMIRKEKKVHGTQKKFEGGLMNGDKVIFVEDVTTTGGSLVKGIEAVREAGGIVEKALVIVDRREGANRALKEINVELIPLVTVEDLL